MIPWAQPDYWGNEIKYVNEALESTWISGGSFINRLENSFSEIFKKKYALAVSNGTAAIHMVYLALGLKPGDEIIVPGFGFQAAANIALQMHLIPVFAEVDEKAWCLSPSDVEKKITSKTKAIVPVHTYGNVCDIQILCSIAKQYGIIVIEDCAESLFSKFNGKFAGTWGNISTFSFQATKTITTGEGGLVLTNNDELNDKMCLFRSHGMRREEKYYWHELPGHNFRITNFQAAMGVAQLEKVKVILAERERVYQAYLKQLKNIDGVILQQFNKEVQPVVWALGLKLDPAAFPQGRDKLIDQFKEKKIETRPGFYSPPFLDFYKCAPLPVSEEISKNVICLPFFPTLTNELVSQICDTLIELKR